MVDAVQGTAGTTDGSESLRFGAGFVDKIKLRSPGFSIYGHRSRRTRRRVVGQYAMREYDLNVQWKVAKKLTLRARYGHISEPDPLDQHENELRLALYYQLR
jgi:hypothetical protein